MPTVLHLAPPDAALACYGLEDWIDTSAAFPPLVRDRAPAPGPEAGPWRQLLRRLSRRPPVDALANWLAEHDVSVVHLHALEGAEALCAAANARNVPVVVSWPRGAAGGNFDAYARVLAPSPLAADRLLAAGCASERLRIAPPPLVATTSRPYPARATAPMRWVTAGAHAERASLLMALEAFAGLESDARLTLLLPPSLEPALREAIATRGLGARVELVPTENTTTLRMAFADAHFGLFPALPEALDTGVPWSIWLAAASGLPCVLGASAAGDGFLHQQHALLAAPNAPTIAAQMAFLSARPYIWPLLGTAAAASAGDRLAYDRACKIPFEVYRQVLTRP